MVAGTAGSAHLSCSAPLASACHGTDLTWMFWKSPAQHQAGILLRDRGLKLQRFCIVLHLVSRDVLVRCRHRARNGQASSNIPSELGLAQTAQTSACPEARKMRDRVWGGG